MKATIMIMINMIFYIEPSGVGGNSRFDVIAVGYEQPRSELVTA